MALDDLPGPSEPLLDEGRRGGERRLPGRGGAEEDEPFQAQSTFPADEEGGEAADDAPTGGSDGRRRVGRWRSPG